MANFRPLKHYMFYCLRRSMETYRLQAPFLDVGCGKGDLSAYLAALGWKGTAIDFSDEALEEARRNLPPSSLVAIEKRSLFEMTGLFRTVFLWDVLEHMEHDRDALRKIHGLLEPGGHLHLAVPSNPREWRWDDDFYGHFRRYTADGIRQELDEAGFETLAVWDFTFPLFWLLRRMYTRLKHAPLQGTDDAETRTKKSTQRNAWNVPFLAPLLNATTVFWSFLFPVQFLFRHAVGRGHEFFVIARKK